MSFDIKKLEEQCGEVEKELSDITSSVERSGEPISDTDKAKCEELFAKRSEFQAKIDTGRIIERAKVQKSPEYNTIVERKAGFGSAHDREITFRAWVFKNSDGCNNLINDEMKWAADRCGVDLNSRSITLRTGQLTTTGSAGGDTVSALPLGGIDTALKAYGGARSICRVIKTATGGTLPFATNDDTGNQAAIVGQNTPQSTTDLSYGQVVLGGFTYRTTAFPVSLELIQDAAFDIGAYISGALGTRLARKMNVDASVGGGTTEPWGFGSKASDSGVTTASATAVTMDELTDLFHSVDPAYRDSPNCAWTGNDATMSMLEKVKTTTGKPLLMTDYIDGDSVPRIKRKPFVVNQALAAPTAGLVPLYFGDFSHHIIRDIAEITVKVLNERYADDFALGFQAYARMDTNLLNVNAIKYLTMHS